MPKKASNDVVSISVFGCLSVDDRPERIKSMRIGEDRWKQNEKQTDARSPRSRQT